MSRLGDAIKAIAGVRGDITTWEGQLEAAKRKREDALTARPEKSELISRFEQYLDAERDNLVNVLSDRVEEAALNAGYHPDPAVRFPGQAGLRGFPFLARPFAEADRFDARLLIGALADILKPLVVEAIGRLEWDEGLPAKARQEAVAALDKEIAALTKKIEEAKAALM
ncbi:MAG: hypothetical protein AMXMBFR8_26900 [Nevskiales bacterium]